MPSWELLATLCGIGLFGSFISGLLGVGGAAFIIPMLLLVPPMLGTGSLGIKEAAGLSIVLIFVGSLSGALAHRKTGNLCPLCLKVLAPTSAAGALVGGLLSGLAPPWLMSGIFASLALLAGILMFFPRPPGGDEVPTGVQVSFPVPLGAAIASGVGLISGLVGAGGAFIMVPLMIYVLKIPTRTAVSTSLGVVFFSALTGLFGKVIADQVPWVMAGFLAAPAIPGARAGAWLSQRVNAVHLRFGLAAITTLMAVRLWFDLLQA